MLVEHCKCFFVFTRSNLAQYCLVRIDNTAVCVSSARYWFVCSACLLDCLQSLVVIMVWLCQHIYTCSLYYVPYPVRIICYDSWLCTVVYLVLLDCGPVACLWGWGVIICCFWSHRHRYYPLHLRTFLQLYQHIIVLLCKLWYGILIFIVHYFILLNRLYGTYSMYLYIIGFRICSFV